jgi:hypothetical protein
MRPWQQPWSSLQSLVSTESCSRASTLMVRLQRLQVKPRKPSNPSNTTNLGAVDLDIFGAFQFCSIAILAAPLTVRLSRTYFYDPGRNLIFLWTTLILAGLIALCVEFYRVTPVECKVDDNGRPITEAQSFPYGQTTCNLRCSESAGPSSPLRGGAANEIYVIPVPTRLTFNAAMLLAAGFCIPVRISIAQSKSVDGSTQPEETLQQCDYHSAHAKTFGNICCLHPAEQRPPIITCEAIYR